MKRLAILGAGTAGTMVANHLRGKLPRDWSMTLIDPEPVHVYQPGLLFLPFGLETKEGVVKMRRSTLRSGVEWITESVDRVDSIARRILFENGDALEYDLLVIATGTDIRPEETEGMLGDGWHRTIYDFYTLAGAMALQKALASFNGGRLVVNIVEMPIKCPVAPLEFIFLADEYFTRRGIRDRVELVYATPLDGAFTRPIASQTLGYLLAEKGIHVESEFSAGEVDGENRILRSWDEREIPYDLLVAVPTHGGAPYIMRSGRDGEGLGDDLDFVPTDPHTLLAKGHDNIFVIGDATNLPSSKAGSVAHFQSEVLAENIQRAIAGRSLVEGFDGHANCFIESGWGKALLVDFNYDVEPLPGRYPLPGLGPFSLLRESRINHWGKLAFKWIYWHALLPARPVPVPNRMSMAGKIQVPPDVSNKAVA